MKTFLLLGLCCCLSAAAGAQATDLIISEYAEGSSSNKYIELYNGTGTTVDLANYEIWKITNGGTFPEDTYALSGTLASGATYIIANGSADPAITAAADQLDNGAAGFNGDDAIGLAKSTDGGATYFLIDAVGAEGADPGAGWDVAGITAATQNRTLVRKSSVCTPTADWTASAGTDANDSEWIVLDQDDFSNLGTHAQNCSTSGNPIVGFVLPQSTIVEGSGTTTLIYSVAVSMNSAPSTTVTVTATSTDGTATVADNDYSTVNQMLDFGPAETYPNTKFVNVAIQKDTDIEPNETFTLNLSTTAGADLGTATHTVTIENDDFPPLVINEILADPDGFTGDANGDGIVNTSQDEFVEIYNTGTGTVDLSLYTLADGASIRHTFALGTTLAAGGNIVVFGGGSPTGATAVTASDGSLGLNNSGDNVTLADPDGNAVQTVAYGSEGGDNQSLARNPDFMGNLVQHTAIASNTVAFSPGELNEGSALPVKLLAFSARAEHREVILRWTTATELDSDYFEVQHSINGRDFQAIDQVPAAGDSDTPLHYEHTHIRPGAGTHYYRLRTVDHDGSFEFSPVRQVHFGDNAEYVVFPNPARESVHIVPETDAPADYKVQLIDAAGCIRFEQRNIRTVEVSDLPPGLYLLQLINSHGATLWREPLTIFH